MNRWVKKCGWLLVAAGLSSLSVFAQTRVEEGNRTQTLHLGNGAEPESLDPHLTTGVPEYRIISALMEGLTTEDPKTLEPLPGVAESWEVSDDGRVYTFKLRKDAKWSNGDPVTAGDFVYSFQRILSPKLGAEYAYMLDVLEGARERREGRETDPAKLGAKALDDHTLELTLAKAAPYFLKMLNHHSWFPVHPGTVDKFGGMHDRGSRWSREAYVSNGPFVLAEWKMRQHIRVKKSPTYWDRDKVKLNEIVYYPVEDESSEERMYRSGLLHATATVPLSKRPEYAASKPDHLRSDPYLTTYYYLINTTKKPFNDPRVRTALSLAIQRKILTDKVLKGGQQPAKWFTPIGAGGFEAQQTVHEDIAKARKLLAEAGYPNGRGFPKFTLMYNTSESHKRIAQVVQQMWKKNLGIRVDLANQEWQVYMTKRRDLDYEVARAGWAGDFADPHNFLDLFLQSSGNNNTGWGSAEYDKLIEEASGEQDTSKRFSLYKKAESILGKEMPVIPVYWYTTNYLVRPEVKGWQPNILDRRNYKKIYLETK